ncbi:hypothetical protein ACFS4T_28665 [Pseudomonas lini]
MIKDNPDLPETDVEDVETNMEKRIRFPLRLPQFQKKLHDAAIRALDHYLAPPSQKEGQSRPASKHDLRGREGLFAGKPRSYRGVVSIFNMRPTHNP